ncbi:uncharacterized protein LOC121969617 isoform X1 [Zingiber officinale]|uniref:uncharacterized protein LOC121969617 isoform X1 n=1 Tax=Zingiber officinale TaxID=94328 RepID=UPI001C4C7D6A|nr:uncharacterized protein LOC121969617 isoform X1 [Zingiber officinale]
MAATSTCDDGEWSREALLNPDLAVAVILSFRQQNRHDREVAGDAGPSAYAPTRPLEWGRRIKRSRMMNITRIIPTTEEEEEEEEELKKRKGKRRASPQSPLEGYSSASASVEEDSPRAGRSTGVCVAHMEECRSEVAVVAMNLRAPEASMNPASCRVRRPSSKKRTKVELQIVQAALIEEKAKILQEIDKWRSTLEKLRVENGNLHKMQEFGDEVLLKSAKKRPKDVQLPADLDHPPIDTPSYLPGRKHSIQLPDLNEPLQW